MMKRQFTTLLSAVFVLTILASGLHAQCLEGNCVNGEGVKLTRGHKYTGSFKNNHRNGLGFYEYPNGDKYEGNFVDGRIQGEGTYHYVNGDHYEGEFVDGIRQGVGTYHWKDGRVARGVWENNILVGPGEEVVSEDIDDSLLVAPATQGENISADELDDMVDQILSK